ncbi:MAG: phenylacetate--CoA ligase family protein, partial [Bacteroidota bacterium]
MKNLIKSRRHLWDMMPCVIKTYIGWPLRLIPKSCLFGRSFRENYKFVRDGQWQSIDVVQKYQLNRLQAILKLAYQRTKFYRQMFDTIGIRLDDFQSLDYISKLPTINKQDVIENIEDMRTKNVNKKDVDFGSTGGTSGTPLHFYMNANRSFIEYAYLTTSWERIGYKLGMPMAVLRGRIVR